MSSLITYFKCTKKYRVDAGPTYLMWATEGASKVWMEKPYRELTKTGIRKIYPKKHTVYTLHARGNGRIESKTVSIKVNIPPPQILYFFLEPKNAKRGEVVNLYWKVIGAQSVQLSFAKHQNTLEGVHRFRAFSDKTFSLGIKTDEGLFEKREIQFKVRPKNENSIGSSQTSLSLTEVLHKQTATSELFEVNSVPTIRVLDDIQILKSRIPRTEKPSILEWLNNLLNK